MIYLQQTELGFDEVGRGCIAGPVTVGCVALTPKACEYLESIGVKDSKKISKSQNSDPYKARSRMKNLADEIKEVSLDFGIGSASAQEIDTLGLTQATKLAYRRSCEQIKTPITKYCIDGQDLFRLSDIAHEFYEKGDQRVIQIACASIIAKDHRDRLMIGLAQKFDKYDFQNNVGYATLKHIKSLTDHGVTENHRKSTKVIKRIKNGKYKTKV